MSAEHETYPVETIFDEIFDTAEQDAETQSQSVVLESKDLDRTDKFLAGDLETSEPFMDQDTELDQSHLSPVEGVKIVDAPTPPTALEMTEDTLPTWSPLQESPEAQQKRSIEQHARLAAQEPPLTQDDAQQWEDGLAPTRPNALPEE